MSTGDHTYSLAIGAPGPLRDPWGDRLVRAVVEDSANVAATATLRFRDDRARLLSDTNIEIGAKLTVKVRPEATARAVPLFTGEVVTLEMEHDGTGTFTTVRALDLSHRLMRGGRVASYVDRRASEIARELATRAKIPIGTIHPTKIRYEMVTQPNISDWDFLKTLAVDNDAEVFVADGKFNFRRAVRAAGAPGPGVSAKTSPFVVKMDENLIAARSTVTSVGQVAKVAVRGWDVRRKREIKERVSTSPSEEQDLGLTPARAIRPFRPPAELLIADVPYQTTSEVRAVAASVASDVSSALAEIEIGVRGTPELRAGVPLTVAKVGKPFDGKYTITASRHVFGPDQFYETWLTVSGRQDRSIAGLTTGANAPARSARVPGLAIGIVTNTKANLDRKHPERHDRGWVKLRFPWLANGNEYETDWVRTVQLGGVGGGGVFCPEVNDEVLVGFEQGLLDRPFVIGGLYNGLDRPSPQDGPLVNPRSGKVNRRSLASRGGNRIELLDAQSSSGPRGVRLRTDRDRLVVHLDDRQTAVVIHSDGTIEIDAGKAITVTGRGITLDAQAGDLTLRGRRVSVRGTGEVDIRAPLVKIN